MTDIKETAAEQLRKCSWWGGAGQALPELYVEQLITEIDRLNKVIEQQRQRIGALESRNNTLRHFEENALVMQNRTNIYVASVAVLKGAITEALSLPCERMDEISGILSPAMSKVEICNA